MTVVVDQKRRVVLPKSIRPGDVLEVVATGDRILLQVLRKPSKLIPPVSSTPLTFSDGQLQSLDKPAFWPLSDESVA